MLRSPDTQPGEEVRDLFPARLRPRLPTADLTADERRALYEAIVETVREVIEKGGECQRL